MIRRIQIISVALGVACVASACGGGSEKATVLGTTVAPAAPTAVTTTPTTIVTTTSTTLAPTTVAAPVTTRAALPTTSTLPPAAHLIAAADIPEANNAYSLYFRPVTMNGIAYQSAFTYQADRAGAMVQINAGRKFTRFVADLSIPDDQPSSTRFKVEISLDGSATIQAYDLGFGETKRVDIDVTNVLRVKIVAAYIAGTNSAPVVGFGNARLS